MIVAMVVLFLLGVQVGIYAALCVASDADDRMGAG